MEIHSNLGQKPQEVIINEFNSVLEIYIRCLEGLLAVS